MQECVVCNEPITNPVCVDCVEQEMMVWLYEVRPDLIDALKKRTDEINDFSGVDNCILCKHKISVCTFCYRTHILDWLMDYPELVEEYQDYFRLKYFF